MSEGEQNPTPGVDPTEETLRIRRDKFATPAPIPKNRVNIFALVARVKTQNPALRNSPKGWEDIIAY